VKRRAQNLTERISFLSVAISTATILAVQVLSILVIAFFTARDLNRSAEATANEIASVLVEPLYNIDDSQVKRIVDTVLSSGRISGIYLESSATGVLIDTLPEYDSFWVKSQTREIVHRGIMLGRLELHYNDSVLIDIIAGILATMLLVIAAVITAGYFANRWLICNRVMGIFKGIISGLERISEEEYGYAIDESGYEDIDAIIRVVNQMSERIKRKNEDLVVANATLEERVAERTGELESALREQRLLQDRLVESEKLTALGQLSAGIAHELNTPLGAIQSSGRTLQEFIERVVPALFGFFRSLEPEGILLYNALIEQGFRENRGLNAPLAGRKAVRKAGADLEAAGIPESGEIAEALVEMGLSDSLDRVIPLLRIRHNREVVGKAGEVVTARRMVEVINESARKAATVVSALRAYLSPQTGDEETAVDIAEDISRVLTLMHNMLKYGITVNAKLTPVLVRGSSDKLSQVWMNLIRNAAEAMEFKGTLDIGIERGPGIVRVAIGDSGPGIAPDIQGRVFEPFFTTKKLGNGMGLGLDICRRIVESQRGTISFTSRPGRTEFVVTLPVAEEPEPGKERSER